MRDAVRWFAPASLFAQPRPAPSSAPLGLLTGTHILVVDDDDEVRRLLRFVLAMAGAHVSEADGAKRGLALVARVPCDAVITDVTMGHSRRDGVRLLERLRATPALATMPVIAITGCRALRSELATSGFDAVLIKPLDVGALPSLIHTLVRGTDASEGLERHAAA